MNRVLQVLNNLEQGGIQSFIMNIYRNIDREKIQFDFLLSSPKEGSYEEEISKLGGDIFRVISRREGVIRNRRELKDFFKKHNYDCIHIHASCPSYMEPLIAAKKSGVKKIIVHSHSSNGPKGLFHSFMRTIHRPLIKYFATDFFACSQPAAKWMFGKRFKQEQYAFIPNGIDVERFKYSKKNSFDIRNDLGVSKGSIIIGHVGRFSKVKNHTFLINVFKVIQEKEPKALLLLVGEGKLLNEIKNKVRELKIKDKVFFLSNRSDVNELMKAMDVFVMPSFYEGLPLSLIEAQATGMPCIVSDTVSKQAAITDLVEFLTLRDSIEIWCDVILSKAVNTEREKYNDAIIKTPFNIKILSREFEKLYLL